MTFVLEKFWSPDPEINAFVARYGIETGLAAIERSDTEVGSVTNTRLTLTPEGAEASYLDFFADYTTETKYDPSKHQYAWWNGTVLGYFYMEFLNVGPQVQVIASAGHMEPPTINGQAGRKEWAGLAGIYTNVDHAGSIYLWKDTQCTEPAPW